MYVHFKKSFTSPCAFVCLFCQIFQGIAHHCLEEKSLKCVFAFSYAGTPSPGTDFSSR